MLRLALPLLLAAACAPGAPSATPSPASAADPYRRCEDLPDTADTDACVARTEEGLLAASGGQARREGPRLVFRGSGGGSLALEDDATEGDRFVRHRYLGPLPGIGQHLVRMDFYEGGGWLLVGAATADRTYVSGPPVVAPDRGRFVTASVDLVAGYDPNGIQVWSLARGGPRLEWGLDGGDAWGASDPVWIDARTVEFTRHVADTGDPDRAREVRTRLVLREDGIVLRPAGR